MKKFLFSIALIAFIQTCFSQDIYTDISGKKVDFFIKKEEKLKSQLYKTDVIHYSDDQAAQPIIYRRKEKNSPDLLVYYTFREKDSTVISILYEWDVNNFEDGENNVKSDQFNKLMIDRYSGIFDLIFKEFGESKSEGSLEDLSKISTRAGLKRKDIWKPKNSVALEMYIVLSDFYQQKGMVTFNPTHKIRLYVREVKQ